MTRNLLRLTWFCIAAAFPLSPATVGQQSIASAPQIPVEIKPALDSITGDELLKHIKVLASDEYEGRAPGTRGETLTVSYLVEQFKRLGLRPGNPNGTYLQKVPLVGFTSLPTFSLEVGGRQTALSFPDDYVARSRRLLPEVAVANSDVVFVGYGIVAPEYGWDDFKNVDVRGKTLIVLDNEPQISDPSAPSKLDDEMFKGRLLSYYAMRQYKQEVAAQKGAAAVLIVHDPAQTPFPFKVIQNYYQREAIEVRLSATNQQPAAVEGWITLAAVERLCAAANQDFNSLKRAALNKNFNPVPLGTGGNFEITSTLRGIDSHNVVARVEGSDKRLKSEYVVYTAHWDHLGRDEKLPGDQIYNGAIDNAGGTAQLLEIAEGFARLGKPSKRSLLFIATTAEEQGLLGAKYYAANPLYPLAHTVANINLDYFFPWGRTSDILIFGYGLTTLDEILIEAAATQKRVPVPDPFPQEAFFFRSDQFEFARVGVPAVFPGCGLSYVGRAANYGQQMFFEYLKNGYHKVSDELQPDWDMSGAVEDAQWLLQVGYRVAQAEKIPAWKPGAEFKARREEMLKQSKRRN